MKISKLDLIRINKALGGSLARESSLDYALDKQKNKKLGEYKKLAYLWRAILVGHAFSDGNKRTAVYVTLLFAKEKKKIANKDLLMHHALSIAKKGITDIRTIEWRLKNAIR